MWIPHGGGTCGELVRAFDWARTPLGAPETWPSSLRTIVQVLLESRHPMFLWWGPELIQIYNDAYAPSLGHDKHPAAIGQRGRDCWAEIWPIIGPQIEGVMQRGEPTWHDNALVPMFRNGGIEEVYWTYGYSPVLDETGGVGGTLVVCTETTAHVIAMRRQALFRGLAEQASPLDTPTAVIEKAVATFGSSPEDIPFVAQFDAAGALQRATGVDGAAVAMLAEHVRRIAPLSVATRVTLDAALPVGPWPEPVREALVVPGLGGLIMFGLSSRLPFDAAYRDFLVQLMESARLAHDRSEAFAVRVAAETEIVRARDERVALIADLEAANRAKDEFLALLGHELRNSLAPIATALDLVRARSHTALSREHELIERHAGHVTRLVDDLLDVSRVARSKLELRREVVAIADVLSKATEMAGSLIEQREHHLTVDLPREPILWWGDPMRLAQVVANLLTNAARYTDRGGEIWLAAAHVPGARIEISVTDNGRGIAPELMPRIFDRFVQGERSGESSQGGLGIGLTLVKSLVELHGGTVTPYSDGVGKGSCFVVSLPVEHAVQTAVAASPVPAAHVGKRVLVVDDNVDAANLMAELLRVRGHDVEVAYDALSALEALPTFQPQVAVFDIGLPVIDGYELAHRVAAVDHTGCRLIAVTGYGQERDSARAKQAGFHRHLVKPVKIDVLLDAISEP
ncbi:MAG TPA: ATP-binding protein [Kofleriaceae bacterium]|jgi:signal transduction histidine kinase